MSFFSGTINAIKPHINALASMAVVGTAVQIYLENSPTVDIVGGTTLTLIGAALTLSTDVPGKLKSWLWTTNAPKESQDNNTPITVTQVALASLGLLVTGYGIYEITSGISGESEEPSFLQTFSNDAQSLIETVSQKVEGLLRRPSRKKLMVEPLQNPRVLEACKEKLRQTFLQIEYCTPLRRVNDVALGSFWLNTKRCVSDVPAGDRFQFGYSAFGRAVEISDEYDDVLVSLLRGIHTYVETCRGNIPSIEAMCEWDPMRYVYEKKQIEFSGIQWARDTWSECHDLEQWWSIRKPYSTTADHFESFLNSTPELTDRLLKEWVQECLVKAAPTEKFADWMDSFSKKCIYRVQ